MARPRALFDFASGARGRAVLPALVAVALLFGGGGAPAPLAGLVVEWAALAALCAAVWLDRREAPWPPRAIAFAASIAALPLLQLVPLPPAVWQQLPGRGDEIAALELVGAAQRWMPWSVSPARTLAGLLALIVPAVTIALTARGSPASRRPVIAVIAAVGLLSVVVGAAQLAGGSSGALRFYAHSHVGFLTGFQANRNAEADVLLIAMLALAALSASAPEPRDPARQMLVPAAFALLALGVILTGSRAGIALAVPVAAGLAWSRWGWRRRLTHRGGLAVALVGAVALAALVADNAVLRRMAGRFTQGGDPRLELWTDTLHAIGQYWPLGSGVGSFVPVFVAAERLEVVDPSFPNRAHNDFLELALEAGLPGLVLLAVLTGWLALRWTRRLRAADSTAERAELLFAGATLAVLGLHSVVDYPLRSMALAALAGVATGIILASSQRRANPSPPSRMEKYLA